MAHTHPLLEAVFPRRSAPSIGDQIASLSHEVARLASQTRRHAAPRIHDAAESAGQLAHNAGDFAGEVMHQIAPLARDVAHRARVAGRVVRDDPVPAVVAIGVFALIATLLLRRQ